MKRFMFDTNAINQLIKENVDIELLDPSNVYFVTSIQINELSETKNEEIRRNLLTRFKIIEKKIPICKTDAETAPWGKLGWGKTGWGQDGGHYERLKRALESCPGNRNDRGNVSDALIIEVCLLQNHCLISNDKAVQTICQREGITCMTLDEFLEKNLNKN